jgi:hypothetical protein
MLRFADDDPRVEAFSKANRITNPRIIRFYSEHPSLSFERANECMVALLETAVIPDAADVAKELREVRDVVLSKTVEQQQIFLEKIKSDFAGSTAENAERVGAALSKHADAFVDKISLLLPKTAEESTQKLQLHLQLLQSTLQKDLRDLVLMKRPDGFAEFAANFDARMAAMQQPVLAGLASSHESFSSKIGQLKEDTLLQKVGLERLTADLQGFLQKQNISHHKGAQSESALEEKLTRLFPTAVVARTTGFSGCGDFKLDRGGGLPLIMLENKNYAENVKNTEVQKFVRDATSLRCSAVLLSQHSGIVGKRDFEIEIDNGNVLVYLHCVEQSEAKITAAVAAIDTLSSRLKNLEASEDTEGTFLPKEALDAINAEVQSFVQKKNALVTALKESHKRHVAQIEEFHLPELFKILAEKYASPEDKAYACAQCARTFESKRALSSHAQRSHAKLEPSEL